MPSNSYDVVMLGDSGGNLKGMQAAATALNEQWKGQGYVHFIPEYYNYADVEKFDKDMKLMGRIDREAWIAQAKRFAAADLPA